MYNVLLQQKFIIKQIVMKRKTIIGIIFIVVGVLKLGELIGWLQLDWLWQQPWTTYFVPAMLVYIGIDLVSSGNRRRHQNQWLQRPLPLNEDGKRICCSVAYGGDEYVFHGETFHGAKLESFCGGIRLDLRESVINEDEEIDIRTFLGGVELLVPETVNIIVKSRSFIGGVSNESTVCSDKDTRTIYVTASNFLGGVHIKNND